MEDLDMSQGEILDVWKIVAAILKLGNVQFVPTTNMDGTEGCVITNDYGKKKYIPVACDNTARSICWYFQSSSTSANCFTAILRQ